MSSRRIFQSLAVAGIFAAATLLTPPVPAQTYQEAIRDKNASTYEELWAEKNKIDFPAPPSSDNLVALDARSIGSGYEYFVDAESVSLGEDMVLRYSVVLESGTGVRNTYFEGIRCETKQAKTYGYVSRQGDFKPLASSPWKQIRRNGAHAYRYLLVEYYVCDSEGWPITEKQVLERLAQNSPSVPRLR